MAKIRSWVGLDVHAAKVVAVCVDAQSGEMTTQRLPGQTVRIVEFAAGVPGPVRVAYEAGPTGSVLVRSGKGGKRRTVGMDDWAWEHIARWTEHRIELPMVLRAVVCGRGDRV